MIIEIQLAYILKFFDLMDEVLPLLHAKIEPDLFIMISRQVQNQRHVARQETHSDRQLKLLWHDVNVFAGLLNHHRALLSVAQVSRLDDAMGVILDGLPPATRREVIFSPKSESENL